MDLARPGPGPDDDPRCHVARHHDPCAGDQVLLLYGSSNHDESVYPNPEELDFDRRDVHAHWAFGHGIHYCLGNAVARVEIRASLQMLLEAVGQWEVDLAGVERNQLVPTRGIAHAPISF